jgi:hypothetical protein
MTNCTICGKPTRKNRNICIGCTNTLEATKKGDQASDHSKRIAEKHLKANPDLIVFNFGLFRSKKKAAL